MKYLFVSIILALTLLATVRADGGAPQVRADSDSHWEKWEYGLPNAGQVMMIQKAAEQGDMEAQYRLGMMYDSGNGVVHDPLETVNWLRKAAGQGHTEAQFNLGTMYDSGHGVSRDYSEAAKWYQKAAEQGYVSAQKNLGAKYGLGQGVPQSHTEAYIWSAIAAKSGDKGAANNRDLAASKLSVTELEAAQKWATKRYQAIQQGKLK